MMSRAKPLMSTILLGISTSSFIRSISVVFHESGLYGMQVAIAGETFDGRDLMPLLHDRKCQTRVDAVSVDMYGARAALTVIAALFCAGQRQTFAERIEQGDPRLDFQS